MQSKEEKGLIIARLFPGEDIFRSLEDVCRQHEVVTAVVLSAAGQLRDFKIGYFNGKNYEYSEIAQTHELLAISGLISWSEEEKNYRFHLHTVLSDRGMKAVGGHLFQGTVEGTAEISLQKTGIRVVRKPDTGTGLQGLYFEE